MHPHDPHGPTPPASPVPHPADGAAAASATAELLRTLMDRRSAAAPGPEGPPPSAIVLGVVCGFTDQGVPRVSVAGASAEGVPATSLVPLDAQAVGCTVALAFAVGALQHPIVLGRVWQPPAVPAPTPPVMEAVVDGQRVKIEAGQAVVMRCGDASLTLTADGQILLEGRYIYSHSTGTQHIKGAVVRIN
jgi:hypothetical protein